MFFILSKILLFLIKPLNWVIILFGLGLWLKHSVWRKRALVASFAILLFFTNGFLINELLKAWEVEPVAIAALDQYDTGIVLTGVTDAEMKPRDRVYFHKGADRVTHAATLYKAGKIKKILISGGIGKVLEDEDDVAGADNIARFYDMIGIPSEDVIIENKARNTYESAKFCHEILTSTYPEGGRHLLVTSAFHQRRAKACFDKAQVQVTSFSCDFHTGRGDDFNPLGLIMPDVGALGKWDILFKELIGIAAYRIAGYL
ncbi:MAG: YdcF family protein [Candidatus Cyclobacteriaceae bacterium M3_2C_046]